MDLLDALEKESSASLQELSKSTRISKTTALRILSNLEGRGFVAREAVSRRYRLGIRLAELGARATAALDVRAAAHAHLAGLRREFNETINLAVPGETGITYIDILQSDQGLRLAANLGTSDDYHSTALGKAIAAFWSDATLDALFARPLRRKTSNTIVKPAQLREEFARIRTRGYAIDDEENEVGARCVGAPLFGAAGQVVAAISVSGPSSRMTPARIRTIVPRLLEASSSVSRQLGNRSDDSASAADR
jgi:IclR family acetate operon transcriptional repressor